MKKFGIVLIVIGLILTLVTGFKFFTKEKVVDIGNVEINKNEAHKVDWSPYVGIAVMVIGGIMVIASRRNL
jgi:uncharacterized membrane protein